MAVIWTWSSGLDVGGLWPHSGPTMSPATKVPTREVGGASTKPKVVRRKAKAERKEEVIKFMVTSEQKRVFAEAAAAAGLDLSGWFRWLATREISGK